MFIAKNEDLIILAKETREELEQALRFIVYTSIEETDVEYELHNGEYLAKEEIIEKEEERISRLTMTALDFITFLRSCGIQLESIRQFLDNNLELDTQLKYCQSVYCGVAESVMPIEVDGITITKDIVRQAFINKSKESN